MFILYEEGREELEDNLCHLKMTELELCKGWIGFDNKKVKGLTFLYLSEVK